MTRGIVGIAGYVPYRGCSGPRVAQVFGTGGGRAAVSVASHDEDTTTMGVEAARRALRRSRRRTGALWFATASPAYLDKTNAATVHAALHQPGRGGGLRLRRCPALGPGALRTALAPPGRHHAGGGGRPPRRPAHVGDEAGGGDAPPPSLVGDDRPGTPVLAEYLGGASVTDEFLDRWRPRATAGPARGRSASARPATCRSAATPGTGLKAPG